MRFNMACQVSLLAVCYSTLFTLVGSLTRVDAKVIEEVTPLFEGFSTVVIQTFHDTVFLFRSRVHILNDLKLVGVGNVLCFANPTKSFLF